MGRFGGLAWGFKMVGGRDFGVGGWKHCIYLGGESGGEVFEGGEVGADVEFVVFVEEDGEEGLGPAGVLDGLGGEEEGFGGRVVVGAVEGLVLGSGGVGGWVFEEKDYAVDGAVGSRG